MADTAANVIDLDAYRARRRATACDASRGSPRWQASAVAFPVALYGFWPMLVWVPFPVAGVTSFQQDVP